MDPEEEQEVPFDEAEPTEKDLKFINELNISHVDLFEDLDEIDDYDWVG